MTIYLTYGIKTKIKEDYIKTHLNFLPFDAIIATSDIDRLVKKIYNIEIKPFNYFTPEGYQALQSYIFTTRIINKLQNKQDICVLLASLYLQRDRRYKFYNEVLAQVDLKDYKLVILNFDYPLEKLIEINDDLPKEKIIDLYQSQEFFDEEELNYLKSKFKLVEIQHINEV